jgi:cation diffusion facilitator family transporter
MTTSSAPNHQRYRESRKVTVVGAGINAVLAVLKVVVGLFSHSHALITDGIHSFSDLASDAVVLYAAKHGSQDADEEHPYGHARIETAFTVALGLLLLLVALGISLDAGRRLLNPELLLRPEPLALFVAIASLLSKEALYHYTAHAAKRLRSPLLHANAWHHRTDALSSVVVLVGVAGAMFGVDDLDALASVGVALMIAKIGWDLGWNAIRELVDTGLAPERVARIQSYITQVDGVKGMHMLRTRRMGGSALVDVHIQVDSLLSVSEGHQIGEFVRAKLVREVEEVADVTVHIDSEDDDASILCNALPLRHEVIAQLHDRWRPLLDLTVIRNINLHYLSGRIDVELILPIALIENTEQAQHLVQSLREAIEDIDPLGALQVYFA